MKTCRICGTTGVDQFYVNRRMKDGLDTKCKGCRKVDYYALQEYYKQASRDYYQAHKAYFEEHNKKYYRDNRTKRRADFDMWSKELKFETLRHYSNGKPKCSCCRENIILLLTLDHIDGSGSRHRKAGSGGGINFYSKLRKQGFPVGYQVLCFSCNTGRYLNGGICPHQRKIPCSSRKRRTSPDILSAKS